MLTEYRFHKKIEEVKIDLLTSDLVIATHSQKNILLDYRKNTSEKLLPDIACIKGQMIIHKQKISEYVNSKYSFKLKVIVPEQIIVNCKLYSGNTQISGLYKRIIIKQQNGVIHVNAAFLEADEDSSIYSNKGEIIVENPNYPISNTNRLTSVMRCSSGGIVKFNSGLLPINIL